MGYQENWLPYYQKKLGHEVCVLTSNKYFPFPEYEKTIQHVLGSRCVADGVSYDRGIKIVRKKTFFEISGRAMIFFFAYRDILVFKPDVVHLHGVPTLLVFLYLPFLFFFKNTKVFIDCHSDFSVTRYKSFVNRLYYFFSKIVLKVFDNKISAYLPISPESQDFLNQMIGIAQHRCVLLPLGFDHHIFNRACKDSSLRDQIGIPKGRIVIINSGKQYPSKKIVEIILAVRNLVLLENYKDIHLLLIGTASDIYNDEIKSAVIDIEDHVTRISFLAHSELVKYYSLADIGIWPGIPSNTIQEAMGCGVALILPDNKNVAHLIDGNGVLMSTVTPGKISESIRIVIGGLSEMKEQSLKHSRKYTWEQIARHSIEIYEKH